MGLILKEIFAFIKLLNSDTETNPIAFGIACGFILGMSPAFSIQTVLIILCVFFFRIQIGAALVSAFFFKFIAFLLDPLFHLVGSSILEIESMQAMYTTMYNLPIVPFTRFNNSVFMGAGVLGILLFPLVFIISKILVTKYRKVVVERFKETKLWKFIKATAFYKWYHTYSKLSA